MHPSQRFASELAHSVHFSRTSGLIGTACSGSQVPLGACGRVPRIDLLEVRRQAHDHNCGALSFPVQRLKGDDVSKGIGSEVIQLSGGQKDDVGRLIMP